MTLAQRVVLQCPIYQTERLAGVVERCVVDGVSLLAIVGRQAHKLEAEADWIIIGDGQDPTRFMCTSAHADEPLEDVLNLAKGWQADTGGYVDEVFIFGGTSLRYRSRAVSG
ncbi:hypothetical protein GFL77_37625 [Rhizobium leguminosarum bv. viciae]|nr:hypothetical protein [Rhizobium leguminosarum bv. viciae]